MSRKTSTNTDSTFTRLLGWTVVLALVFSAGMITGQRLIRHDSMPPLVSLSVSKEAQAAAKGKGSSERVPLKTTFSFYDHLSDAPSRDDLVAKDEISAPVKPENAQAPAEVEVDETVQPNQDEPKEEAPEVDEPAEVATEQVAPEEVVEAETEEAAKPTDEAVAAPAPVGKADEPATALIDRVTAALGADAREPSGDSEVAGQFTIQVGNHVSKASAVRELARLRAMSFDAHMMAVEVSGKRFYRVRVGKYASDSDARAHLENLGSKDINGMVVPL